MVLVPIGRFLTYCFNFLIHFIVCSDFLFIHDSVMLYCMFLGIDPFLLLYPISWYIIFHRNPHWLVVFLYIVVMSSLSVIILLNWILSVFSWLIYLKFVKFVCFNKNLGFVDLFNRCSSVYFIIFFLIFIIFLLLPTLGLVFFTRSFRCKIRLYIGDTYFFLNVDIYCL
jgi:hypothetical protein